MVQPPQQHSPSSQLLLLRKCSILVVLVCLVPLGATYWHLRELLAVEGCSLRSNDNNKNNGDFQIGLTCRGRPERTNRPYFLDTTSFAKSPPCVARLASLIAEAAATVSPRSGSSSSSSSYEDSTNQLRGHIQRQQQQPSSPQEFVVYYNYAEESVLSWLPLFGSSRKHTATKEDASRGGGTTTAGAQHGMQEGDSNQAEPALLSPSTTPIATYFWFVLNLSLFGWYKYRAIDSSRVALNGELFANGGDFGRAISGNLAHFTIWHIGFNSMSLWATGKILETETADPTIASSIGMVLWTGSFLVLGALGETGLYAAWNRRSATPKPFPSSVGFSGVLFTWTACRALSSTDSNPLVGSLRFSWQPFVQLFVIQLVMFRQVSFVGHLSGLLLGLFWHWGFLPSLEVSQPCVLYPVLWMVCKHAVFAHQRRIDGLLGNDDARGGDWSATATRGGVVLGSSASSSSRRSSHAGWFPRSLSKVSEESHENEETNHSKYSSRTLRWVRNLANLGSLHGLWMVYACRGDGVVGLVTNGLVLSELLLLALFWLLIRVVVTANSTTHYSNAHPFGSLGVLGRAYVAFAVVAVVTDSMALGGWWAIPPFGGRSWDSGVFSILMATRFVFWILSASVVCCLLEGANEMSSGIWCRVLGWSVAEPCAALGRALMEASQPSKFQGSKGKVVSGSSPTSGGGGVSGRSVSNVAGKSRLVDRIV